MPEEMQIQMRAASLARRLGVPFHSVGALKVPDAQAACESATQLLGAFMAGVHFIIHGTGCLEGPLTMRCEKTLMDADRCAALQKFAAGVDLSPAAQALDAIREVGPSHHFLGSAHTPHHFETANFLSDTSDTATFEQWTADGSRRQHQRLDVRFKEMLAQYEPPPMDEAVREGIDDFVARLERLADAPACREAGPVQGPHSPRKWCHARGGPELL